MSVRTGSRGSIYLDMYAAIFKNIISFYQAELTLERRLVGLSCALTVGGMPVHRSTRLRGTNEPPRRIIYTENSYVLGTILIIL